MTSIYSGKLYNSFVTDQNRFRLANYDVNRFQKTIEQSAAQGRLEKELRDGLEFHQAIMADLQTKLNELTEKLNNIYRRYMDNQVAFNKPKNQYDTQVYSDAVAMLPRVDDPNYPNTGAPNAYPAGANGILPYDDYDKIRNFSYNPYFGSKAIEESDLNTLRTYWEQPGTTSENTYRENGAFWSTLSYLWGWDLDRINATYVTSDGLSTDPDDGVQINITALQPNKPQYPPVQVGDRYPLNWTGDGSGQADYPAVNIGGLRPGGADYNHATDSINTDGDTEFSDAASNVAGHDSLNFGWEFDDLPMALEVVSVDRRPDGTTVPTEYKVVYDIPPTHPHYDALKVLNGTEPMIMDAPTEIQKDRINNDGFRYSGYTYVPGAQSGEIFYAYDGIHNTGGSPWATNTTENEYPPPKLYTSATVAGAENTAFGGTGTQTNPILVSAATSTLFGQLAPIQVSNNGGTTYPFSTTVSNINTAVRYNTVQTRGDTGTGDDGASSPITVDLAANNFEPGDYVTFSGIEVSPGVPYVYIVNSPANSTGFTVDPVTVGAPMPPLTAGQGGVTVSLWDNAAATVRKYSPGSSNPNYQTTIPPGQVGLVLNSPAPFSVNRVKTPDQAGATEPIMTFVLNACSDVTISPSTNVSMKYKFTVHQNFKQFASPGDDGELPQPPYANWSSYEWTNDPSTPISTANVVQNDFGYPIAGVNQTYIANAPMGAGPVVLGRASDHAGPSSIPGNTAGWFTGDETVSADIVQGANPNEFIVRVFFEGDLNGFEMEVEDIQLVDYTLNPNTTTWTQGMYNPGNFSPNPDVQVGDPTYTQLNSPDEVVNKYIPGVYQFTQFNDQYNNSYTAGDANDIIRSPWEFAQLDFGANSGLSGEMWLDLNGRRLNLGNDSLQGSTTAWGTLGAASTVSNTVYDTSTASSDPHFDLLSGAVQNAHSFEAAVHPGDDCIVYDPEGNSEAYQASDSDPLSTTNRNDTVDDEVLGGEAPITSATTDADPSRTSNPGGVDTPNYYQASGTPAPVFTPTNPGGGNNYLSGQAANDLTGTVDRVGAAVKSVSDAVNYTISIPTTDVNVLKNENNLLINFGSVEQRDWSINVSSLDMFMRTIPGYTSTPRYRVDAGGNIYDRFGDGHYDVSQSSPGVYNNPTDAANAAEIYTLSNGATRNGQVSNANGTYGNNPAAYNTGGSYEQMVNEHDRFSLDNDDFNLFDYTPNLNVIAGNPDGATKSEVYVGSLPSNFYYYREILDQSGQETGTAPTGGAFNNDKKPAINFDGRNSNLAGGFDTPHTSVFNTDMPSFVNVNLGLVEQDAKLYNTQRTTTSAVWLDFPALDAPLSYSRNVVASNNVDDAINAVGNSDNFALMNHPTSSITLNMGRDVNTAGYLVINEEGSSGAEPHAIPLPLLERTAPYPSYTDGSPTSYDFDAYGRGTVTRTGSKFMSFDGIVDAADGMADGVFATGSEASNMNILTGKGGEFAVGDPLGNPSNWPDGVLLHVDDASKFELEYPKNIVVLGDSATRYRVMYRDTTSSPQTMFLVRDNGADLTNTLPGATTNTRGLVHADLQIRELTGTYTVSVRNDAGTLDVNGQNIRIDYNHNGTEREGKLVSVGLSSVADKVGRIPGDDPRTPGTVEALAISPEVFDDPKGYVQPDAQVQLNLVSQDKDGNLKPRKLTKVKVELKSGEQIIPTNLQQIYSTFDESTTGIGLDDLGNPNTPSGQPFDINGGAAGNWPIALYDGDTQINPLVTDDIGYFVGYYQGILAPLDNQNITVVDASDFKEGQLVSINGEQRTVQSILGNVVTLDEPLVNTPILGDRLNMGTGTGEQELKMFLNRNIAMSMGAGIKVTFEYEEYDYVGYPPTVDKSTARVVTEEVGFSEDTPKSNLQISPVNTGTGAPGDGVLVSGNIADYAVGDIISVNGITFSIAAIVGGNRIELGTPEDHTVRLAFNPGDAPKVGQVSHKNYEDFLAVGKGRTGGSSDNDFTHELKRIIDSPEYADVFRQGLFSNIFISASVTDPFNDVIASKLFLNWDRQRRQVELLQSSFSAYYQSI